MTTKPHRNEFEKAIKTINLQFKPPIAMSAPYQKVLLIGATSGICPIADQRDLTLVGIGLALAEKYAETGTHVVAVGRRRQQLDALADKYPGKVSVKIFDISALEKIPQFVEEVIAEHSDLGCVFLNR